MKNFNSKTTNMILIIFMAFLLLGKSSAENSSEHSFLFSEITCWDLLLLSEEERPNALVMIYGYHAGLNKHDKQDTNQVSKVLIDAGKKCENLPDSQVLDVLSELMK